MDVSSYVLLSHEQALRRRLDITANNMANLSTAGFKRQQPMFHDFIESGTTVPDSAGSVSGADRTAYVLDYGATHDSAPGAFTPTSNPLDIMIEGPGYFSVQTPEGGVGYTRAGNLKIAADGTLVTANGQPILGDGDRPVVIPADDQAIVTITTDGTVMGKQGAIGRLKVTIVDEASVTPRGDGLMNGDNGQAVSPSATKIKTGGIEASNVQPIAEATAMVDILRAYQSSQAISQSINDMRSRAIDRLSHSN